MSRLFCIIAKRMGKRLPRLFLQLQLCANLSVARNERRGMWERYRAPHSPDERYGNVFQTGTDLLQSTVTAFPIHPVERGSRRENELGSSHYAYGKYVGLS